jgi:ABC-type Fe3+/spermidine/putrescine transport system ATPase subunit
MAQGQNAAAAGAITPDHLMPPAVLLSKVWKSFGGPPVVRDASLSIAHGEFFSLLGSSGCGKSTTLRLIAGFDFPDEGSITVCGSPVLKSQPAYAGPVNMVFQNYALFPHLTAGENAAFGLRMQGISRAHRESRARDMLALVRMQDYADRLPAQLSGGQQQRVALARALATQPQVVLLDEPLGALDLRLRREMQAELRSLQQSLGLTFVHVTHDQEEALSLSDRLCIMDRGSILQTGSPAELYQRPASSFVAGFLGESNLLTAAILERSSEAWTISTEGITARIPAGSFPDSSAAILLRPEHLRFLGAPEPGSAVFPEATVVQSAFRGPSHQVQLRLPSGTVLSSSADAYRPPPPEGSRAIPWCRPEFLWPLPPPPPQ